MPKTISHFEVGVTQTWVVVNDNGTVTLRIGTLRSSKAHTLSAAEAIHRWPTLAREIKTAIWEICGEAAPKTASSAVTAGHNNDVLLPNVIELF